MVERWMNAGPFQGIPEVDGLIKEIDDTLAHSRNEKLKIDGTFIKARLTLFKPARFGGSVDLAVVEGFLKLAPRDPRSPSLLAMAATVERDPKIKSTLEERILKDYADSPAAREIAGTRRQKEAIGKPFELEFTEAIHGSTISMAKLKGKVVVVDFWATWCSPCVAEMPKMKELYAKYRDQGVEFIGVSLDQPEDQGGLTKLRKFVKEEKIGWPQYYQGKGWESEFSSSWGINAIPAVFVVDQEGKLYSIEARGKLKEMIPSLLKKKVGTAGRVSGD
jgi:thiol-disulfide isomerase/thioredoxin